ncbi:MAG: coth protein-domain-containing protein [Benjaminiella poitrasii]|nr:MAG: coth protein-domain-containing protein [Benjaminiella poitrasii]
MKRVLFLLTLAIFVVGTLQRNITYSVIAASLEIAEFVSVVVIIDDTNYYPLTTLGSSNNLLYQGQAPIAQNGYRYSILLKNSSTSSTNQISEAFTRSQTLVSTPNEFFNRSRNIHEINHLPEVYKPLSAIHRIKSDLHRLNQIPTIHIWGVNTSTIDVLHENQHEDYEVHLNVTYYGLHDVQTFEDVEVSLAGRSSRFVPKLSYNLKMKTKGDNSLYGYKKLKLRALAMDRAYVRECISYTTLRAAGVPSSGFSYVRLVINNRPIGLYGLIETFQDPWLANVFANGDKDYRSGFLYQGRVLGDNQTEIFFSDLSYYGENLTTYSLGQYEIKAGDQEQGTPEDFEQLKEFTKFINETDENTSVDIWASRLDTEGFIRAMAVENLLGFSDAYMTLANNFYLYSNPQTNGKMIYIPADLDTTLGVALYRLDSMLSGNYSQHPGFNIRPLTNKLFSNTDLLASYKSTLFHLTKVLINPDTMYPFVDSVVSMIYPDVEWDESLPKVGEFSIKPFNNVTDDSFLPSGFRTNWTEVPQTFQSSLDGPTNSTTLESVKGFIAKKSTNVLSFYKELFSQKQ